MVSLPEKTEPKHIAKASVNVLPMLPSKNFMISGLIRSLRDAKEVGSLLFVNFTSTHTAKKIKIDRGEEGTGEKLNNEGKK